MAKAVGVSLRAVQRLWEAVKRCIDPTTAIADRSYGPLRPKRSSKNSPGSLYPSESVH